MKADGETLVNKVKGVFAFKVKSSEGKEGVWIVDAKNGNGSVEFGGKGKHCLLECQISRSGYLHPGFPNYWFVPGARPHLHVPGVTEE